MNKGTTNIADILARANSEKKHTISLHVANRPGALIRIALVFARRGYNIDSLVVSPSNDPEYSMMNIAASGDEKTLKQILNQLNKLIDVVHASNLTGKNILQRELALIKIRCSQEKRSEILQLSHALNCQIVDISETVVTLQITGSSLDVDNVTKVLLGYEVMELVRTGKVLMARGEQDTA
jgi:acetolactate synthase I/III small subunit